MSTSATILVAITAAILSWHGLTMLGERAGFGKLSVFLPIVIDGTMLVGALHVLHASLSGLSTRWGWGMTLVGVAFSTWGNVVGASTTGVASGIVHAIPALALAASVEATMRVIRHGISSEPDRSSTSGGVPVNAQKPIDPTQGTPAGGTSVPVVRTKVLDGGGGSPAQNAVSAPRLHAVQTLTNQMTRDQLNLAAWVRERKQAGESHSAAQATRAGVATSDSSAKRALARLRQERPEALEPSFSERTGS